MSPNIPYDNLRVQLQVGWATEAKLIKQLIEHGYNHIKSSGLVPKSSSASSYTFVSNLQFEMSAWSSALYKQQSPRGWAYLFPTLLAPRTGFPAFDFFFPLVLS